MLVTFHTDAWNSITMYGDVAVTLLKMAGHSGTVPSAMLAADIPSALASLERKLAAAGTEDKGKQGVRAQAEEADTEPAVGLRMRAHPLIQLLSAAARKKCDVIWEEGQ